VIERARMDAVLAEALVRAEQAQNEARVATEKARNVGTR
jgi:hypothetical protein